MRFGYYCHAPNCLSSSKLSPQMSFHRFPKAGRSTVRIQNDHGEFESIDVREAWIRILNVKKKVTCYMKICSLHFKSGDFFPRCKINTNILRQRLKLDAVPSLNIANTVEDQRVRVKDQRQLLKKTALKTLATVRTKFGESITTEQKDWIIKTYREHMNIGKKKTVSVHWIAKEIGFSRASIWKLIKLWELQDKVYLSKWDNLSDHQRSQLKEVVKNFLNTVPRPSFYWLYKIAENISLPKMSRKSMCQLVNSLVLQYEKQEETETASASDDFGTVKQEIKTECETDEDFSRCYNKETPGIEEIDIVKHEIKMEDEETVEVIVVSNIDEEGRESTEPKIEFAFVNCGDVSEIEDAIVNSSLH